MFLGQYSHNIDSKGRLAVPVKFRNELKKAVVTKGFDNCLFLYPKKEWEQRAESLSKLPFNKSKVRAVSRMMLANAMEVEFDKQGRIILPGYLRSFAGLKKKAIVAGVYDRLEIWDEQAWDKYQKQTDKDSNAIAEELDDLMEKSDKSIN